MTAPTPSRTHVAENLVFDARLALFHEADRWLAIADLHYGYELSLRSAGALFPAWGMEKIEARLDTLLTDYQPATVLFLGDLVHTAAANTAFARWVAGLETKIPQLILLRGNHDRRLRHVPLHDHWRIGSALFHHGDRLIDTEIVKPGDVIFSGHLHPAKTLSDGAGIRHKLPALCHTSQGWILPAFSPWAAGGEPRDLQILDQWVSTHEKIWRLPDPEKHAVIVPIDKLMRP